MSFRELWERFISTFGLFRKSPFVQRLIHETNFRIAIPMCIYTLLAEKYMYNRTVMLWHLVTKNVYDSLFAVLAFASIQLLVISILYLSGKVRKNGIALASIYVYVTACSLAGQTIAAYDFAIGKQVFVFLPMVAWIFALLLIHPAVSIASAVVSFYLVPSLANSRIVLSNYVNQILMLFAVMLEIISIVRWVSQLRAARNEEEIAEMNRKLSELSLKDELTGLRNRHALRQDYDKYRGRTLITAMCDIDDFKFYNDTYGHDAGDLVLKHMADTLSSFFGKDGVYRFGGDEYLLILEKKTREEFEALFHAWKDAFSRFEYEGAALHPGSTCGYCSGLCKGSDDLRQMIAQADQKLYEGKMSEKGTVSGCDYHSDQKTGAEQFEALRNNLRSGQFDSVTRLPNLSYFRSQAPLSTEILKSSGHRPVLVYLNLKNFSTYNRRFGFEAGDELLRRFGEILKDEFSGDLLCRFTDDHFALITAEDTLMEKMKLTEERLAKISKDIRNELRAGFYGLDEENTDITAACDCARQAMNLAGEHDFYRWYDSDLKEEMQKRQYIADHFDEAVEKGWIEVVYQPILRTATGRIAGMEVLSRWNDPVYGRMHPDSYISVLESAGLICLHDLFILNKSLENYELVKKAGRPVVPWVINLSWRNFENPYFAEDILELTKDVNHELMHFDINAGALSKADRQMEECLDKLIDAGFQLWMDGFGSSSSTVDILYHFGLHGIKIDIRSLHEIGDRSNQSIMLSHIISMCKEMKISTLALGVENEKEMHFLEDVGCEYMQGYYFSASRTFEECAMPEFLSRFEFEPLKERDYYRSISHVNLSRPTQIESNKTLEAMSAGIPAAVCEYESGKIRTIRSNYAFHSFLAMMDISDTEKFDALINQEGTGLHRTFQELMERMRTSEQWETAEIGGEKYKCFANFHTIAVNPANGALAVVGVVLDMNSIQKWKRH